jgi:predicted short-subunit dehydrogenase-like oxidoreductase (DUF2520 family)
MAWFLGSRLNGAGFECKAVYGRNEVEALQLSETMNAPAVSDLSTLPETDCCIITVSDRVIPEITENIHLQNTVVIHTAGSVSLDVISQQDKAVLWCIYSINKKNLPYHTAIPAVYEASTEKARKTVLEIASVISDIISEANFEQRQWLHLCAVISNNFTNHLMAICEKICDEQQLPFSLLQPILKQTFRNIDASSPVNLQTGPARRNDIGTTNEHLALLAAHPLWQQLYQVITKSIEDMYSKKK